VRDTDVAVGVAVVAAVADVFVAAGPVVQRTSLMKKKKNGSLIYEKPFQ